MAGCKECGSEKFIKNGRVRGQQRYRCKECGLNFIEGDKRQKRETVVKKALCVLLYSLSKASFNMLGKLLGHSPSIIYRWVKEAMDQTEEPKISGEIKEISFDEIWHFLGPKKTNFGSSKRLIVAQGKLLHGLQVLVILKPSKDYTTK